MIKKSDEEIGKFISLILRHDPSVVGIRLDENGWANVDDLIKGINAKGVIIDFNTLKHIVESNTKQRYSFNDDQTKIRANQGHSINVDVELKETLPPVVLFHGTAGRFLDSILENGITHQSRQYVHLSDNEETAKKVGMRYGKPIVLIIAAKEMSDDGYRFFLSENGVWLCKYIPKKYIRLK